MYKLIHYSKIAILFFVILISNILSAQEENIEPCGFDDIHQEKLLTDPLYKRRTDNFEESLLKKSSILKTTSTDYKIPVVVHVMNDGTSLTDITDEEIYDAIFSLNERFRKIPGSIGDGNGVDVTLEFSLAVRDPNGNCTNGIVRYDLSGNSTYVSDGVMRNTSGISDTDLKAYSFWNSNDYYNIWLVSEIDGNNGGSGIQGYAYFASAHGRSFDGALVLARNFKNKVNTTLTHELGHAFNLHHTFKGDEDGESCPLNNNCSTDGDMVCDTPPHIRSASDCQTGTNSCDGGSSNDLFMHNYMDYSSDDCVSEFTAGQATRVIAAMTGDRSSFLESNGNMSLVPVSAPTLDFVSTSDFVCTNSSITLIDRSTCVPNSYVNSGSYSTISYLWTIQSGSTTITSTDQNPTINFTVPGVYDVTLSVTTSFGTETITKDKFIYVDAAPELNCQPSSSNNSNYAQTINNVTLNTLNNSTDIYINEGYSDFRCSKSTVLVAQQTYTLSVDLFSNSLDQVVEVYIDYNNNGSLEASELVLSETLASATDGDYRRFTADIVSPINAVTNTPLLMRVIGEAGTISPNERSCSSPFLVGDVEDYTVIIQSICSNSIANAGADQSVCFSSPFTASGSASNGTVSWSTNGTGTFDDSSLEDVTYTPGAEDINNGSVVLTMTVDNDGVCLDDSDDLVLTITGTPNSNAGIDGRICEGSSFTTSATSSNGDVVWSTSGSGTFNDISLEDVVYTPSSEDIINGSVGLSMTVSSVGCSDNTDDLTLIIDKMSVANAGDDLFTCVSNPVTTSSSSSNGTVLWSTNGDGTFDNLNVEDVTYTPGVQDLNDGSVVLTMTVINPGTCLNDSDDLSLSIVNTPSSSAGDNSVICSNETFVTAGTSFNGNITWASSGTGSFNNSSIENATYTPSSLDISNNTVTLTMTVSNGVCQDESDDVVLTINEAPVVTLNTFNDMCVYSSMLDLTGGLPLGGEYKVNNNVSSNFDPLLSGVGVFTISYDYTDLSNDCSSTAVQTITVGNCASLDKVNELSNLKIFPNPVKGVLNVVSEDVLSEVKILDYSGRVVDQFKVDGKNILRDISQLSNGIYYLEANSKSSYNKIKFTVMD